MLVLSALIVLLITLVIGVPIPLAFLASAGSICLFGGYDPSFLMTYGYNKTNSILLLTIPLFVLAGAIMDKGGIGEKLIGSVERFVGKVKGGLGSVEKYHNIHVVYTKEAETADAYIEKATYEIGREHRVKVATSDGPEQLIILGHGALRLSAAAFRAEMEETMGQMAAALERNNRPHRRRSLGKAMEKAMEGEEQP